MFIVYEIETSHSVEALADFGQNQTLKAVSPHCLHPSSEVLF